MIKYKGWEIKEENGIFTVPFGHYQGIKYRNVEAAKKAIDSIIQMNTQEMKATYKKSKKDFPGGDFIKP